MDMRCSFAGLGEWGAVSCVPSRVEDRSKKAAGPCDRQPLVSSSPCCRHLKFPLDYSRRRGGVNEDEDLGGEDRESRIENRESRIEEDPWLGHGPEILQ